jgi:hypothetical protein
LDQHPGGEDDEKEEEEEEMEDELDMTYRRSGVYKELVPIIGYVSPR